MLTSLQDWKTPGLHKCQFQVSMNIPSEWKKYMPRFQVYMSDETLEQIKEIALKNNVTLN